mgnify:CR=1 FL=1
MNFDFSPPWQHPTVIRHTQRLIHSFHHWTGQTLISPHGTPEKTAQALFEAAFVVVSHGTEDDPVLNYGNQTALDLWEMDWQHFTQTPSRFTAEPMERSERSRLLQEAREKGYISNYEGVRISSTGKRFQIRNVILWDVLDEKQVRCGQAATFDTWKPL